MADSDFKPGRPAQITSFYQLPTSPAYEALGRPGLPLLPSGDASLRNLAPFLIRVEPPPALAPQVGKAPPASYSEAAGQVTSAAKATPTQSAGLQPGQAFVGNAPQGGRELDPTAPQVGDRVQVRSVRDQVAAVASTPPLVLYINPQSFSVTRSKVQQLQDRSRYGFIYQPWGEEAENVSIVVQCGAFVSPGRGVQRASRADSAAWQQLEAILLLYQNGGSVFDPYGEVQTPVAVGRTTVRYDGWTWSGHLEQLGWAEDEQVQLGGARIELQMVADYVLDEEAATGSPLPITRLPSPVDPPAPLDTLIPAASGLVARPFIRS